MIELQEEQEQAVKRLSADETGVTVIIPAFNEELGLPQVLVDVVDVLGRQGWPYEILVVDDGSDDLTSEVAIGKPRVRVLRHQANRGYGAALKTGLRHAHFQVVVIIDADQTYPHERLPELIHHLLTSEADMVVGARIGKDAVIPLIRRPAKWAIRKLAEFVAGEAIPDVNSGLRVFRRSAVLQFFRMLPDGFSFTTTITLGMLTNGYLVHYLPIEYFPRIGKSKIKPIRDTLNFTQLVLRIALYFAPLKIFLPLSFILIILGLGWGLFSALVFDRLADSSMLIILMTGVQTAILGLLAELFDARLPNTFKADDVHDR